MGKKVRGETEAPRRRIAPVLLTAALIFTTVMAVPGQTGKRKSPRGTGEGEPKPTVVRRVSQVRVSAPTARAIRSIAGLRGVVAVRGRSVRPLAGSSIWQLSNGGYAIVETTAEPEPDAMEVFRKNMGLCDANGNCWWYFAMCFCLNGDPNNDACNFGGGHATRGNCRGGACCTFQDGLIDPNGAQMKF